MLVSVSYTPSTVYLQFYDGFRSEQITYSIHSLVVCHQVSLGKIHFSKYSNQNGQVESKLETKQGLITDAIG